MADPDKYDPSYNFSGFQSVNPSSPLPATQVDVELEAIQNSIGTIVDAVKDVRRSDGKLANQSVGPDQLSAALSLGFTLRGTWMTATSYSGADGVTYGETFYKANYAHTSDPTSRPDLDPVTWTVLFTFSSITTPDGSITPAKLSADEAGFRSKIGLGDLATRDETYLASSLVAATEKTALVGADLLELIDSEALFVRKKAKLSSIIAAVVTSLGQSRYIGEIINLSGPTLPPLCLYAAGQAVSRATYAAYFAEVGTTYGAGNGSTTFNMPDYRGRTQAGKDDMGGSAANRLTNSGSGIVGTTLGAKGGAQTVTLSTSQMPSHNHSVNVPSHSHTFTTDGALHGANGQTIASGKIHAADGDSSDNGARTKSTSSTNIDPFNSGSAGSGSAHNNVQPTIICNVAIFVGA